MKIIIGIFSFLFLLVIINSGIDSCNEKKQEKINQTCNFSIADKVENREISGVDEENVTTSSKLNVNTVCESLDYSAKKNLKIRYEVADNNNPQKISKYDITHDFNKESKYQMALNLASGKNMIKLVFEYQEANGEYKYGESPAQNAFYLSGKLLQEIKSKERIGAEKKRQEESKLENVSPQRFFSDMGGIGNTNLSRKQIKGNESYYNYETIKNWTLRVSEDQGSVITLSIWYADTWRDVFLLYPKDIISGNDKAENLKIGSNIKIKKAKLKKLIGFWSFEEVEL